eukprot:2090401-Ditylum_brightwellii.AAC.1
MQTEYVTVIDVAVIVTSEAKEATVVMTDEKEIAIMWVTKASSTMWKKSAVALAPDLRVAAVVAAALQATAAFQAAATLVLVLCQMTASK